MTRRLTMAAIVTIVLLLGILFVGLGTQAIFAQTGPGEGLRAEISGVEIPADRKAVVTFRLTDGRGAGLRVEDMDRNSVRFIMNRVASDPQTGYERLLSYTVNNVNGRQFTVGGEGQQPALANSPQATFDSDGTFTSLGDGRYTYKFGAVLPGDFDVNATHRVAMQATRLTRRWVANDFFDFRPNGQAPAALNTVQTASCNECHDLIRAHGGQRYEVELCTNCHTEQTIDPESANTVDMKVMVHKIHFGASLPSVEAGNPYYIVGFNQSVHDYSDVVLPQDVRNCETCHTGPLADSWKTKPSAAACGSCHDDVNFETGANHPAGAVAAGSCATCHPADGPEFGASVAGAHVIPTESSQLRGVTFNLLGVTNTAPGQQPVVAFNVKDKAGAIIDPNSMNRLAFTLAGPTYDYQVNWNESALGKVTQVADDRFEFTFPRALPADASFVWTAQIEGYLNAQLRDAAGSVIMAGTQPMVVRDAGFDQSIDFTVMADVAWPRKTVVTQELCESCHERLYLHGGNRQNVDNCLLCHNPNNTDAAVRPTSANPPTSIDFKVLIHRIHSGAELNQKPYVVYGFRSSVHDYSEVALPTDRRVCENCHLPQSNYVDFVHWGAQPVVVRQGDEVVSTTPPTMAACSACHDSPGAVAHMRSNVAADLSEGCIVCHGEGRQAPVSANHRVVWPVVEFPR